MAWSENIFDQRYGVGQPTTTNLNGESLQFNCKHFHISSISFNWKKISVQPPLISRRNWWLITSCEIFLFTITIGTSSKWKPHVMQHWNNVEHNKSTRAYKPTSWLNHFSISQQANLLYPFRLPTRSLYSSVITMRTSSAQPNHKLLVLNRIS